MAIDTVIIIVVTAAGLSKSFFSAFTNSQSPTDLSISLFQNVSIKIKNPLVPLPCPIF